MKIIIKKINRFLLRTGVTKFYYTRSILKNKIKILDIGLDNFSIDRVNRLYQNIQEYHGVDVCDISDENKKKIDPLDVLEDGYYDLVIMNHVVEHLEKGLYVIDQLSNKVKQGGVLFVEFPNVNSLNKHNSYTYNFHCDTTHKRIYTVESIANILLANDFEIVSAGYSKPPWKYIYAIPNMLLNFVKGNEIGSSLAHVTNKISHVYARKR